MWNLLEFDSHTALVNEKDEICTYAQLYRESEGLAEHIDGRCLVFSLCSNSMGSVLGYVTFLNHRIVPLMLDEHIDRSLLNGFLDTYHPNYLWLPRVQADSLKDVLSTKLVNMCLLSGIIHMRLLYMMTLHSCLRLQGQPVRRSLYDRAMIILKPIRHLLWSIWS